MRHETPPTDPAASAARLLEANQSFAEQFADGDAPKRPTRRLFILTCMDPRVEPLRLLGLGIGDAHVVRNAGGRVSDDVVRSAVLSSTLLGTDHAVVIHHTDCGLGPTTDEAVRSDLAEAGVEVGNLWLGTFDDLDGSVREDVAHLRAVLGRRDIVVSGFVYDVSTGRLRQVDLT